MHASEACLALQPCLPCVPTAELSNKPAVVAAIGYADKVELRVLRPDSVANPAALSYKVDVHNKDGSAVADKQGVVPTADSAPGTIYNATTLTLTLGCVHGCLAGGHHVVWRCSLMAACIAVPLHRLLCCMHALLACL